MSLMEYEDPEKEKLSKELTARMLEDFEKGYEAQEEQRQWKSFLFNMIWWGVLVLAGIIICIIA